MNILTLYVGLLSKLSLTSDDSPGSVTNVVNACTCLRQSAIRRRERAAQLQEEEALLPGEAHPERVLQASIRLDGPDHPLFSHHGEVS